MIKQIAELSEIEYIENLPLLRVLNLLRNPIQVRVHFHQQRTPGQVRDHFYRGVGDEGFLGTLLQEVLLIKNIENVSTVFIFILCLSGNN